MTEDEEFELALKQAMEKAVKRFMFLMEDGSEEALKEIDDTIKKGEEALVEITELLA